MSRQFTLEEARSLLALVVVRAEELVRLRADLVDLRDALAAGKPTGLLGGIPEAKAMEARIDQLVDDLVAEGVEVKGLAPLIVDFPSSLDGKPVLLCWLENEPRLAWYHRPEQGFLGRRRIK